MSILNWAYGYEGQWEAFSVMHDGGSSFKWVIFVKEDGTFSVDESDDELTDATQAFQSLHAAKQFCEEKESEFCKDISIVKSGEHTGAIEFLKRAGDEGRIVSSNDLTEFQIVHAQAGNRFYVDPDTGYGWAIIPWNLRTRRDDERELTGVDKC